MQKLHFIGIGGVGMSGIAKVAKCQGYDVSGSDLKASRYTAQLEEFGIPVAIGQSKDNIPDGDVTIIVSTAILDNNPELAEAKRRGLDIIHRADMLSRLGDGLDTLAVAGTHGKTTTSSMLASVLDDIGANPTFLIGGIVRKYDTNARRGVGRYYVIEADESDKSFTKFNPAAAIITNIEPDHLDHYADLDEIYEIFSTFMQSLPSGAPLIVCFDDKRLYDIARKTDANVVGYGFGDEADARIISYTRHGVSSEFELRLPNGRIVKSRIAQNPGVHNVLNGAAVLTLVDQIGEDVEAAAEKLCDFKGVKRRFDLVGQVNDISVIDDYAHHPTEIAATIKAAHEVADGNVHVIFQPHRYSRASLFTEVLHDEFGSAFDAADTVIFMDVFSAGETPIPGVNGKTFMRVVEEHPGHPPIEFISKRFDVAPIVGRRAKPGDMIITMGAGDVTELGRQILDELALDASASAASASGMPSSETSVSGTSESDASTVATTSGSLAQGALVGGSSQTTTEEQ